MNPEKSTRLATASGAMAILLWSSLALMTVFTAELPPFQVLAISFAVGGIASMFAGGNAVGYLRGMRQPWPGFVLAVAALYGYHALYFIAFRHAPAVEVNLVNYLWPLLIVVFAGFLPAARPRPAQFAGTALGLVGVGIMLGQGRGFAFDSSYWVGYLSALGAALTWSTYSVLNRQFRDVPSSTIGGACLTVALLAAISHLSFERTISPTGGQWLVLILMGLGPVGVAFRLWDRGTKHGDIAVLGTLSYAAPLLSTVFLLLSGAVSAHWSQAIAVMLLMIGAWISVRTPASGSPTR